MKTVFAGLLGASLALATPTSAKSIGTMNYDLGVMPEMCKSDVERGAAGFCTGYLAGLWKKTPYRGFYPPFEIIYEGLFCVVIHRFEFRSGCYNQKLNVD
jgi:hypothetical protein